MKICPNCKTELDSSAKVCPKCGKVFTTKSTIVVAVLVAFIVAVGIFGAITGHK